MFPFRSSFFAPDVELPRPGPKVRVRESLLVPGDVVHAPSPRHLRLSSLFTMVSQQEAPDPKAICFPAGILVKMRRLGLWPTIPPHEPDVPLPLAFLVFRGWPPAVRRRILEFEMPVGAVSRRHLPPYRFQ